VIFATDVDEVIVATTDFEARPRQLRLGRRQWQFVIDGRSAVGAFSES